VIRTNLATRPFYNERAVQAWLLMAAIVVVGATLFNGWRILHYSGSNTELAAQAARDEARAAELRGNAARLRATVDPKQIEAVSVDAREANDLIDRRTFSWTELLNRFETTLPADVRITAVRPHIEKDRRIILTISVLARSVDDVNQFMENMDATAAFTQLTPVQEHTTAEGQIESTLEAVYVPKSAAADDARPASTRGAQPAPGTAR
jgi:Tfp pilus assembly protein PilN